MALGGFFFVLRLFSFFFFLSLLISCVGLCMFERNVRFLLFSARQWKWKGVGGVYFY